MIWKQSDTFKVSDTYPLSILSTKIVKEPTFLDIQAIAASIFPQQF